MSSESRSPSLIKWWSMFRVFDVSTERIEWWRSPRRNFVPRGLRRRAGMGSVWTGWSLSASAPARTPPVAESRFYWTGPKPRSPSVESEPNSGSRWGHSSLWNKQAWDSLHNVVCSCPQVNPGTVGFYRIQYSSAMLESLLPGIRDLSLQPVDRLGLQNDLFSLVNTQINTRLYKECKAL